MKVGDILYGYCGGYFGRDSHEQKTIEALNHDWVIARDVFGNVHVAIGDNIAEKLEQYLEVPT